MSSTNYYYDHSSWMNTVHSLNIQMFQFYANMIFNGDQTRVLYASNSYALRKRVERSEFNNLNLPFLNFKVTEYNLDNDLQHWNDTANLTGIYIPELRRKIRYTPVIIEYEAAVWTHKLRDLYFTQTEFLWDDSNQTIITIPVETVDGHIINLAGHLESSFNFSSDYNENEWLERNKISTSSITFSIRTMMLKDNFNVSIPEEVILNFLVDQGIDTGTPEENYDAVINLLEGEVGEF